MEGLEYWIWVAAGILLVLMEIVIPTFTALWFGVGAIVVGVATLFFPELSLTIQLLMWAVLSTAITAFWFKFVRPMKSGMEMAKLSRESIVGEVGMIVKDINAEGKGVIRFTVPLLGSNEWNVISTEPLKAGDRAIVKDFSGNSLIVESIK
ncbi:NfeD family protein [Aestuariicella hydrocarbonica]|uniref:NfeD family protein n=1 Tax=Pseudomaricurvus hydrocarbonicus TaxID=1470433 RepID=A0A9E5MK78_9GAMM|nr:NfeD family protein [Aestuariicella hydrocarbonica]NHO65017.1 NfeD family protein [Aestuariicella hydrocarbonica]